MRIPSALTLSIVLVAGSAVAQDAPAPKLNLSGTYEVTHATVGEDWVTLDFKATIMNMGETDADGQVLLRHPNVMNKVWERFGDQSIPAGGQATVSASTRVPRDEYDGWTNGSPSLFFYTKDDRGDIKTFRIPLSKAPMKKAS